MTPKEIRELRKELGMNQPEFALLLGCRGIATTISRWEKGHTKPQGIYLKALLKVRDDLKNNPSLKANYLKSVTI